MCIFTYYKLLQHIILIYYHYFFLSPFFHLSLLFHCQHIVVKLVDILLEVLTKFVHIRVPLSHCFVDGVLYGSDTWRQCGIHCNIFRRGGDRVTLNQLVHLTDSHSLLFQHLNLKKKKDLKDKLNTSEQTAVQCRILNR